MEGLLQKTRKLNKTLQNYGSDPVSFLELSRKLSDILQANVYIASKKGKVLGYKLSKEFECDVVQDKVFKTERFPKEYNDELLAAFETKENVKGFKDCVFDSDIKCDHENKIATIVPIRSAGERLGTLLLARFGKDFTEEDMILAEYSATIVGMEILRSKNIQIEIEARKKSVVQMAIGTLSYSELEAMEHIFNELDGSEEIGRAHV